MDARKRGRPEAGGYSGNGGFKRSKQEMDSSGVGSKSKPCTKFFSTAGCPFGEICHFLHHFPGGYNVVAQMMNLPPIVTPPSRNMAAPPPIPNGSGPHTLKNRMCNRYNSAEGCKFGDQCHFAHGEWELGNAGGPSHDDPRSMGGFPGRMGGRMEPRHPAPSGFGASATAKVSVSASLAGAIIGKGGVHSKMICRETGVKLSIRDHEADPSLRNIELEGSFEQIQQASAMVKQLIATIGSNPPPAKHSGPPGERHQHQPGTNFKTKMCDNFAKGICSFGQRCHFAHGAAELRRSGI